jgi:hypothetical protein
MTDYREPPGLVKILYEAPGVIKVTSQAVVLPDATLRLSAVRSVRLAPANEHLAASWLLRAAGVLYAAGWALFYVAGLVARGARFFDAGDWWVGIPNLAGGALAAALGARWRGSQRERYRVLVATDAAPALTLLTTEDEALGRSVAGAIGQVLERGRIGQT